MLEKSGNMRLDRSTFAYVQGAKKGEGKFFFRVSGKASQQTIVDFINTEAHGRMQSREIKDDKETPIVVLQEPDGFSPAIMLIGNTDLILTFYEGFGYGNKGKNEDLVQELLDVRAKKKPNAMTGKLKDRLAKIPEKAVGLLVGDVPTELKVELQREFEAVPDNVLAYLLATDKGLEAYGEGSMANEEAAGKLVQKIGGLRKEGIAGLQKVMQQPLPPARRPFRSRPSST